ncbi:hypothetical protein GCM10009555_098610 [Acrocarpospora macrocephala]|uniref:Uncharacterized protein n=1 Tax=Acrocarpospora macrocephala TaxID=150177 RepID=A0A5M3X4N7_9ACTN|nr:hypothetical protein Amac_102850 [Acrocarpospora macrocephala]
MAADAPAQRWVKGQPGGDVQLTRRWDELSSRGSKGSSSGEQVAQHNSSATAMTRGSAAVTCSTERSDTATVGEVRKVLGATTRKAAVRDFGSGSRITLARCHLRDRP